MTQTGSFAAAVTGLLTHLNMDIPAKSISVGEVYTARVGPLDIELSGSPDGRITLFCFPGVLPKLHLDSLATLLLSNRYQHAYPPILTSLVGQTVPPKILLWSSLTLAEAGANNRALTELFVRVAEAADEMQSWLDETFSGAKGKQTKSSHIDWLKNQAVPARTR